MSDYDRNIAARGSSADGAIAIDAGLRAYMLRVYNYMAAGVGLTGVAAFVTYQFTGPELLQSPLMWVLMLAPLGLVFFISARINTLSVQAARGLFFLYAVLVGISLSTIFHIYTQSSITRVFFISAAAFGALSIWGYTTQRNLSGFGTFLFMGLIGIIIASLVNLFLRSSGLDWMISIIGVGVFAGLTAYDTQRIKGMYDRGDDSHRGGPQGRDGSAFALPQLHQPFHDAAASDGGTTLKRFHFRSAARMETGRAKRIGETGKEKSSCAILVRKQVLAVGRCCWVALHSQRFLSSGVSLKPSPCRPPTRRMQR